MNLLRMAVLVLALTTAGTLSAEEHPKKTEHPKGGAAAKTSEHPEHPEDSKAAASAGKGLSIDELEAAIKRDVAAKEKAAGGTLAIEDDKEPGKTWHLKLDHVHRERLSRLDAHTYFACSDFKSQDGHLVDVDFFEKEKDGKLSMSDMTIHKVDGKARYGWEEKDGFWKRVPAAD